MKAPALRSLEPGPGADAVAPQIVPDAVREKVYAAERRIAWLRVLVTASNTLIYGLLMESAGTVPWLAWPVTLVSTSYAVYVLWAEPYRRFPVLHTSYFTATSDTLLILVWIGATGGVQSPFFPLTYLALLTISLRHPPRTTVRVAATMGVGYVLLVVLLGQVTGNVAMIVARLIYLSFVGWLGGGISRDALDAVLKRIGLEERLRAEQALRSSQSQLAEAEEMAHLGSWDWDFATGRITASAEYHRIFGFAPAQEITFNDVVARLHPDDLPKVEEAIRLGLESDESMGVEYKIVLPSGELRWIATRGRSVRGIGQAPERMVGTSQDVTSRKDLQERLVASERLVSLGTLAGGVAHEINNPLMYIVGNLDFLEGHLREDRLREALQEARHGAERVRRIVQDLKTFSPTRLDEGGPGDVRRALELSINMTRNEVRPRANLALEIGDLPLVAANESRLGQVFVNLLLNAAQAIAPGNPDKHWVRVRAQELPGGRVEIEVEDTGSGIEPGIRSRIFEPFFTTKAPGGGTGLGLAICHGIVQGVGGSIVCDSEVGRGTIFRITLPVAKAVVPPTADSARPPVGIGRGRVLVVDDDPLVGAAMVRMLARENEVALASTGEEAVEQLRKGLRFDLILCDLSLTGLTAMEMHARFEEISADQTKRIVLMNAGGASAAELAFLQRVGNPCLDKPIDARQLQMLLRERLTAPAA